MAKQKQDDTGCNPEDQPGAMNDREKWSGISVLAARHDDDDDDDDDDWKWNKKYKKAHQI